MADTSNWIPGTRYYTSITDQDHAGWLYIVTLLSLAYILIVFVVRTAIKYGMYGRDDWTLVLATFLAVGQDVALLIGLGKGMGKAAVLLSRDQVLEIEKYGAAHVFLFVLAHCVSKLSIALLTQRLFETGRRRNLIMCWALVGATIVYGLGSVVSLAVRCPSPAFPTTQPDQCNNRWLRWQLVTALDVATEILLVLIPCSLLADIQIKRDAKLLVMAVFAVRLPIILFSALNMSSLRSGPADPKLAFVLPVVYTQVELLWSIIAASVPCLKTFMRPFDSINEETWRSNNAYPSQRSGRSWHTPHLAEGGIPLERVRGRKRGSMFHAPGADGMSIRPDKVGHNVVIAHTGVESLSYEEQRRSWGSQDRIIKAQRSYEVRSERNLDGPYESSGAAGGRLIFDGCVYEQ